MIQETQIRTATWCPVCDSEVSRTAKDTRRLLAHIRECHRKLPSQYVAEKDSIPGSRGRSNTSCSCELASTDSKSTEEKVYATRGDTWKLHTEKKLCPRCRREAVPRLHTHGDKLTSSHMGALCLLGCWPLCFIPLMMKCTKKVRMICPMCGHIYGSYEYKKCGLTPCKTDSEDTQARATPSNNCRSRISRGAELKR